MNSFDKSVCLYYSNASHRGPGKVVENLKKGIEKIGGYTTTMLDSKSAKYHGMLQFCHPEILNSFHKEKRKILLGPNLFVLPNEIPALCENFIVFVVPAAWVKDLYSNFDIINKKNIYVWSVGIDTDAWQPDENLGQSEFDCLIYYKNRTLEDLRITEAVCKKFNLSYKIIKYGEYKEEDLLKTSQKLVNKNGFAILLTGTESQGIAQQQIMSTGLPCYVFNQNYWKSDDGLYKVKATSVPYFDQTCGAISDSLSLKHFDEFLQNVKQNKYSPRKYILDNHTLEKSAYQYFDILEKINDK